MTAQARYRSSIREQEPGRVTSVARVVVHEPQLPAARCALRACEGDGGFEDLGLKECVHELVVCAVAERLCLVADGGGVLGGLRRALFW